MMQAALGSMIAADKLLRKTMKFGVGMVFIS